MFQHFFVPLDGSARAEKAIPVAARLAQACGGTVIFARVLVPPSGADEYGANVLANETRLVQAEIVDEARTYLDEMLVRYAQALAGIHHLVAEVAPGHVPSTLFELAEREQSDLIVMCSRGDNWLKRSLVGSVTQATFRHSPLPVLALSEHGNTLFLEGGPLRILVPLDGEAAAETVLEPVFQLLALVTAPMPHRVHLLQIIATPAASGHFRNAAPITDALQQEECQRAEQALKALAGRLASSNPLAARCAIISSVVINPDVAGTIVKHSQAITEDGAPSYDLVALATHGRTGIRRALMGSVTEHVFGATSLPLLVVHPPLPRSYEQETTEEKAGQTHEEIPRSWVGLL